MSRKTTNETPLQIKGHSSLEQLNFSLFPRVEDLEIQLVFGEIPTWRFSRPHIVGALLSSRKLGLMAGYKWWETIFYLNRLDHDFDVQDVPKGTIKDPKSDFQPGWEILIFEHEKDIYILEGGFASGNKYHIWFRVNSEDYSLAWMEAMDEAKRLKQEHETNTRRRADFFRAKASRSDR